MSKIKHTEKDLSYEYLKENYHYDPETGIFQKISNGAKGWVCKTRGYHKIKIKNREWTVSRLAWYYMTGALPTVLVDHVNKERADNRWINLRLATGAQNLANSKSRNVIGLKGVHITSNKKRYKATIKHNRKQKHIGTFDTPEEAHSAYMEVARIYFGEFASG